LQDVLTTGNYQNIGTPAAPVWEVISSGIPGTVTSVAVNTVNGFAGSIATPTTTPVITLFTSEVGIIFGDGTGIFGIPDGLAGDQLTTDGAGNYSWQPASAGGTVTTVSIVPVNGFTGTVANPTTTPSITLTTNQLGILVGDGTSMNGLPDGLAGQFLSTDGAGNYSWQASSALQYYAEPAAAPTVAPVSGAGGSIAIGDGASAIGSNSIVWGSGANDAGGQESIVFGSNATSNGVGFSIAIGRSATASGVQAVAIGDNTTATGNDSVSIGNSADATADSAYALGESAQASALRAVAIGRGANVSGQRAVGLGAGAQTAQDDAIVLGASSNNAVAVGIGTDTPTAKLEVVSGTGDALSLTASAADNALNIQAGKIAIATGGADAIAGSGNTGAGQVTINTTSVTASSLIFLTSKNTGSNAQPLSSENIVAGVSFDVTDAGGGGIDFDWFIIN